MHKRIRIKWVYAGWPGVRSCVLREPIVKHNNCHRIKKSSLRVINLISEDVISRIHLYFDVALIGWIVH